MSHYGPSWRWDGDHLVTGIDGTPTDAVGMAAARGYERVGRITGFVSEATGAASDAYEDVRDAGWPQGKVAKLGHGAKLAFRGVMNMLSVGGFMGSILLGLILTIPLMLFELIAHATAAAVTAPGRVVARSGGQHAAEPVVAMPGPALADVACVAEPTPRRVIVRAAPTRSLVAAGPPGRSLE